MTNRRKFSPSDAARVAIAEPPIRPTPARDRITLAGALLWCRNLQFPTVRDIRDELGLTSPSSVVHGFGRLIRIQASVIQAEWSLLENGWFDRPDGSRDHWLSQHADHLAASDPALLRLPGLVCSAVLIANATSRGPDPSLVAPLHCLAAFADRQPEPTRPELARSELVRPELVRAELVRPELTRGEANAG